MARIDTNKILRDAEAKIEATFWTPRPLSAEAEARVQILLARQSLVHGMDVRRFNLRCFPGLYRRDRKEVIRASVARLELAAKRRRHAAELLAQVAASKLKVAA